MQAFKEVYVLPTLQQLPLILWSVVWGKEKASYLLYPSYTLTSLFVLYNQVGEDMEDKNWVDQN